MQENQISQAKIHYNLKDYNISSIKNKFIALDFETTGLSSKVDKIVEIGAVLYENGVVTKTFSELVNPNHPISNEASRVSGITNEMIESSPDESVIYPKFIEFLGDAIDGNTYIVAHNARFEISFITETFNRLGYQSKFKFLDTLYLARYYIKDIKDYHQSTVAEYFNIHNKQAHRATTDAETCGNILLKIIALAEHSQEKSKIS